MFKKIKNKTKRNKKKTDAEGVPRNASSDTLDSEYGGDSYTESLSEAESSDVRESKTQDSLAEGTQRLFHIILKCISSIFISTL